MTSFGGSIRGAGFGLVLPLVVAGVPQAQAQAQAQTQAKLDATYTATLAGMQVGRGAWTVTVDDDKFTAAASGMTAGILRMFSAGRGNSAARGVITASGQFVPAAYTSNVTTDRRKDEVRMVMAGGAVRTMSVEPPVTPDPERIPVSEAHRRSILDPMTAALTRVPGSGSVIGPQTCQRTLQIFDGRIRYELDVEFKRIEQVKAQKGYQGPVAICGVVFKPIAGHIPDRAGIKWMAEQRGAEIWVAPIGETRVVVPFKMVVPTPVGNGVLEASSFVVSPLTATASKSP